MAREETYQNVDLQQGRPEFYDGEEMVGAMEQMRDDVQHVWGAEVGRCCLLCTMQYVVPVAFQPEMRLENVKVMRQIRPVILYTSIGELTLALTGDW